MTGLGRAVEWLALNWVEHATVEIMLTSCSYTSTRVKLCIVSWTAIDLATTCLTSSRQDIKIMIDVSMRIIRTFRGSLISSDFQT